MKENMKTENDQTNAPLPTHSTATPSSTPAAETAARLEPGIIPWEGTAKLQPWLEPVNGKDLLDELSLVLRRFVLLPRRAEEILALWVLHTYAFELRDVTTYLGIESPEKRCGKTTLLA